VPSATLLACDSCASSSLARSAPSRSSFETGEIPRPVRWGGALGLAPVPGPFDEAVLLLVGGVLWLFYRDQLHEAWQRADRSPPSASPTSTATSGSTASPRRTGRPRLLAGIAERTGGPMPRFEKVEEPGAE
jgi:hypothetical protein